MLCSPQKSEALKRITKKEVEDTYSAQQIDDLNMQFERAAQRQIANKSSVVRLTAAERDLLQVAESIRDKLVIAVSGEKGHLAEVFGGDCSRFHRIRRVLDEVQLSEMHATDQRWRHVAEQMAIIEEVLKELGLYKPWVPKKKAPENLKYMGVRSRLNPGDKVVLRPAFEACEDLVFSVEPALPEGLELNPSTGEITGKVDAEVAVGMQTYVVTVRNDGGEATYELAFAVAPPPPGSIVYPGLAETLFTGEAVRFVPEKGGGSSKEWAIEPDLPSGLSFSSSTGEIAGVPSEPAPLAAYLVSAANASGSVSTSLQFEVTVAPPLGLSYPDLQEELLFGTVAFLRPEVVLQTSAAQAVGRRLWSVARMRVLKKLHFACMPRMEFSIEPPLPEGLVLGRRTGIITGVPAAKTEPTTYKVGVSNGGGEASVDVSFAVRLLPPSGLVYPEAEARYFTSQEVNLVPEVRGLVESWEVAPELPTGLKLNPRRGTISGTLPEQVLAEATWTVVARNSEGEVSTPLTFAVVLAPPSKLAYPTLATEFPLLALPLLRHISATPTVTGQAAAFAVEPELPPGLELDQETGVISGAALERCERTTFKVTASNETGSTTVELGISVKLMRPVALSYPEAEALYTVGEVLSLEPSVQGCASSWAVEPPLPSALEMDPSTGAVRGTLQEPMAPTTYVVTASNEAGKTTSELRFAVTEPQPEGLEYPECATEYPLGQEVHLAPELRVGSCVRFSVEPELPQGLYLDPTSGVISGAASVEAGAETYVITGTSKTAGECTVELTFACLEPVSEVTGVTQRFAEAVEEVTDIADLMEEPGKGKVLGDWMVWMVHRVHLNDPSLTELSFTNLWMPPGHMEPRIAPKLVKAIAQNTQLVSLQLSHCNFQKPEGHLLADSLKENRTLQILNVESNSLDSDSVRHMAQALHENPGSVLETWRFSNQKHIGNHFGRPVEETIGEMMEKNQRICKLGFACADANWRMVIDRAIMRNIDFARKRRRGLEDGEGEALVAAEEKPLSRLILSGTPDKKVAEVFGEDERLALVQKHVAEFRTLPTHQALQAWVKGQGKSLPYSAVKPLLEDFRARILNAAIEKSVSVQDTYGAEFSGEMRSWSEKNGSWSLDVWPSGSRRFNFTSDKQPTIEVAGSFMDWLQRPD